MRDAAPPAPLAGRRVLDLSRLLPGPYCTLILAELGADVVKVEDRGAGDYLRHIPPVKGGVSGAFQALNRGKRSIAIDLKRPAGRELLLRLLPAYDVVVETFRPGVMERLGLGYETLRRVHPGVVLCSITGYGQDGPLAPRAGHDIGYQALAGVLSQTGEAGGDPPTPGIQVADIAGGALWGALRILAALLAGGGAHLDVSMTEGAMSFLVPWFGDYAVTGEPLRRGAGALNGAQANYRVYRAGDGRHLAVGALEPKFWGALRAALGQPVDLSDPVAPPARQAELREEIAARLGEEPRDALADRLAAADACVEPVLEMDELEAHPQHRARGMFFTLEAPGVGPLRLLRLPLPEVRATRPAPAQGEHTAEVLEEAGVTAEEIATLRRDGVIP